MEDKDRATLLLAVRVWVGRHPEPDAPVLSVGVGRYTPRQIFSEVEKQTEFGQWFVRMIDEGIATRTYTLGDVLQGFSISRNRPLDSGPVDPVLA